MIAKQMATYAKQLVEGMRARVQRDPDIADYLPEFTRLLQKAENEARLEEAKWWGGGHHGARWANGTCPQCERMADLEKLNV